MKHLHTLGIIFGGFKTAATCCGKRVKLSELALTEDTDCPGCRASAEEMHAAAMAIIASADADNRPVHSELREKMRAGPTYRNAIFGG